MNEVSKDMSLWLVILGGVLAIAGGAIAQFVAGWLQLRAQNEQARLRMEDVRRSERREAYALISAEIHRVWRAHLLAVRAFQRNKRDPSVLDFGILSLVAAEALLDENLLDIVESFGRIWITREFDLSMKVAKSCMTIGMICCFIGVQIDDESTASEEVENSLRALCAATHLTRMYMGSDITPEDARPRVRNIERFEETVNRWMKEHVGFVKFVSQRFARLEGI